MSLKAKLEAVIYAAEEPVTLAQLVSLFAEDAFAWNAEREQAQRSLALSVETAIEADSEVVAEQEDGPGEESGEEAGMADSTRELTDLRRVVEEVEAAEAAAEPATLDTEVVAEPADPIKPISPVEPEIPARTPEEAELEARRLQRIREREVREILRIVLD